MIVVASNGNESPQVTLPGFSICVLVPVIRGLPSFLTMAKVAEVEDGVVIIDCVAILYEEGEGGEHYRNKNKFRCWVSRIEKRLLKLSLKFPEEKQQLVEGKNADDIRKVLLFVNHSFSGFEN